MNLRPSGYEPDELPDCSTPHQERNYSGLGVILQPETSLETTSAPPSDCGWLRKRLHADRTMGVDESSLQASFR